MVKTLILTGMTLVLSLGNLARADVVVFDNPTVTLVTTGIFAGDYSYEYGVQLDSQEQFQGYPITNGSSATNEEYCLAGINGLVAGSASIVATAGFTVTQGTTGGCNINAGVLPGANTGAWVEVLYTGAATYGPSSPLPLIAFYSTNPESTSDNLAYGGSAYNKTANLSGSFGVTANQGEVEGPTSAASSPVPEPSSLTLFGSALLGIGFFARVRSKREGKVSPRS